MAVFLALLFTGCGANTATESAQPEKTTADIAAGSTQPETTARTARVPGKKSEITAETAPPSEKMAPATVAPVGWVTAIGDRVIKGAVRALQREIPDLDIVDVQGSLQAPAAIDILRQRRAAGQLGDVVVHIGNNGPFSAEKFDETMQVLASVRKVLVVSMMVPHGVNNPVAVLNNAMLAERVRRYPNVMLVDWHAANAGHPEFVERDGIHLTLQGAQAYADLTARYFADP